jgi:hypothetical protein
MANVFHKARRCLNLLSRGLIGAFLYETRKQAWSGETSYGLRRDLRQSFTPPPASIPIMTRLFETSDREHFLGPVGIWHRTITTRTDQVSREEFIEADIPSCYVAVTDDGSPCFIQWLLAPTGNNKVQARRQAHFPRVSEDEILLEGAFVPERHRGKKIMASAMSQVAEKGRESGARWAITYVEAWNLPSLRGCLACGFHPYLIRKVTWRGFARKAECKPINNEECAQLEASWQLSLKRPEPKTSTVVWRYRRPLSAGSPKKGLGLHPDIHYPDYIPYIG